MIILFSGVQGAALMVALLYALVNFIKYLMHLDQPGWRNAAVTQVVVWLMSFLVVYLFAHTRFGDGFALTESIFFRDATFLELVVGGLLLGSGASALFDVKKAFDGSDSAATPAITRTDT